jgi:hypothetical protein
VISKKKLLNAEAAENICGRRGEKHLTAKIAKKSRKGRQENKISPQKHRAHPKMCPAPTTLDNHDHPASSTDEAWMTVP